jgi:multicomponent Na+:H+ antiporter subunit D
MLAREVRFGALILLLLGVASALYGGILAATRKTVRETLAYSSISQAGYILVGLAIGGVVGLTAAVLMAVVNALNKTMLFMGGSIQGRLARMAFAFGAFSIAGIPPSVGFFGKTALFRAGVISQRPLLVAFLFVGAALVFVYMFRAYQRRFWVRTDEGERNLGRQLLVLALALLIVALGVWPEPLLAVSQQAVTFLQETP